METISHLSIKVMRTMRLRRIFNNFVINLYIVLYLDDKIYKNLFDFPLHKHVKNKFHHEPKLDCTCN